MLSHCTIPHSAQLTQPLTSEDLEGDLIQPGHPLFGIVWINKQRMSGTPCFSGTRVPVKTLFEYVESGEPLEEFLEDFEGVTLGQAEAVLALAGSEFLKQLPHA
jgi:uncharacterized protein (DUF433 family)